MLKKMRGLFFFVTFFAMVLISSSPTWAEKASELKFDHTHLYSELVEYLQDVINTYPQIARLHKIGKSYEGRDLLVMEITNKATGEGLEKPAYWLDGCIHSGELIGGEICLDTIQTLVTNYNKDPFISQLVDTTTYYIMPRFNPDGTEHWLTKPTGVRCGVRPFDDDDDGLLDEDPAEDLNGDGFITLMRVKDEGGPLITSPEDPRLMVPRTAIKGEWRVYPEGIDNDKDGMFNEDGVGGLDQNRNWPDNFQPEPYTTNPGPYPLSEPEDRAVADFFLAHRNICGMITYHISTNLLLYPLCNLRFEPMTGEKIDLPPEDDTIYKRFGGQGVRLINNAKVQALRVFGISNATASGFIWGTYIDWLYWQQGIFAWMNEPGRLPGITEIFPARGSELERIKWSDEHMDGKLFMSWKPYDHPQLGKVEIGGFIDKIYDPKYKAYNSIMQLPGPDYEKYLTNNTKWNLWLIAQSPFVRITEAKATPEGDGYYKIEATIQNIGYLPTYVTQQAVQSGIAKTVKVTLSLAGAELKSGEEKVDIGHLGGTGGGGRSPRSHSREFSSGKAEWMVKVTEPGKATAIIKVLSEKGGADTKKIPLK